MKCFNAKSVRAALVATAIGILFAGRAQAADYSIVGNVSKVYATTAGNPQIEPTPSYQTQVGVARIYQVDLYINASGFNAGADQRGFGNVRFDIARTAGLGNSSIPNWQPNTAAVDSNGASPGGTVTLWAVNTDTDLADLQNIVASIAVIPPPTNPADPRPNVGQYPSLDPLNFIGSVFIDWSGTGIETLTLMPDQASFAAASTGEFVFDAGATLNAGVLIFGVPEPSSAALAVLSLATLTSLARRRRKSRSNAV